jgi:hypothetical protein
MAEGAWGLVARFESGGPENPDEVIELAKIAASYGGNYTTHVGSEGYQQKKELAFAIRVAEGGTHSRPHLSPEDSRQGQLGHRWRVSRDDRGGARARARRDGESISVHGDEPRLERLLPGLGA